MIDVSSCNIDQLIFRPCNGHCMQTTNMAYCRGITCKSGIYWSNDLQFHNPTNQPIRSREDRMDEYMGYPQKDRIRCFSISEGVVKCTLDICGQDHDYAHISASAKLEVQVWNTPKTGVSTWAIFLLWSFDTQNGLDKTSERHVESEYFYSETQFVCIFSWCCEGPQ